MANEAYRQSSTSSIIHAGQSRLSRQGSGQLARRAFEILWPFADGLSASTVISQIERDAGTFTGANGSSSFIESRCRMAMVAPLKAGWVRNDRDRWTLTEPGREAFFTIPNASAFVTEAGSRSTKGWLSVHFPTAYLFATDLKYQMAVDLSLLKRVGVTRLMRSPSFGPSWQDALPLQPSRRVLLTDEAFDKEAVSALNRAVEALGSSQFYRLPLTDFAHLEPDYPTGAELIIDRVQGIEDDRDTAGSEARRGLPLVANLLFAQGLAPRLLDRVEIGLGARLIDGYIVQARAPVEPSDFESRNKALESLKTRGLLKMRAGAAKRPQAPEGAESHPDEFLSQTLADVIPGDYGSYLETVAREATAASHFGDRSLLRGGKYLYQSIPGVRMPARRNTAERTEVILKLIQDAGLSLKDRVVLDIGCNIGMMMAEYLRSGARWCHGWDRKDVAPHVEKLLLALGCTRFSVTGGDISSSANIDSDLPSFISHSLDGCVVSYLAVRGTLGWLEALGRIPWAFMIYEGHEDDSPSDFDRYMGEFRSLVDFKLAGVTVHRDGDSAPRTLAILVKQDAG